MRHDPRLALLALALCAIAACRSEPERTAVVVPEPDCPLRAELEAATRAPEPAVRRAAVRVLGERGPGGSLEVVGALLVDPDPAVQLAAVEAIGRFRTRGGDHGARVAELLASAVRGGSRDIRYFALCGLGDCQAAAVAQVDTIRACFQDEPQDIQIAAAIALGEIGATEGLEERAVELIQQNAGGAWDYSLAQLLPYLYRRDSVSALERLLASDSASVRFQAECARARLAGVREPRAELEAQWAAENSVAADSIRLAQLRHVPRSEPLDRAGRARLVLCGEMHESEGPIRENQRAVLRAFVKQPAFEAVGFEPSVEDAQSGVLDLARSLGLNLIPLETNWRELGSQDRAGARELETLELIERFLSANPSNRMLVLRGESHVLPGGFLVRRLSVKPLVILCGCEVSVPLHECGLHCNGSSFELGTTGDVYVLPYDDESTAKDRAALERWLAIPTPRTP